MRRRAVTAAVRFGAWAESGGAGMGCSPVWELASL